MEKDGQDLNAGDPHLDGEGEYTPPAAGEGLEEGVNNDNPAQETIQGDNFMVGGSELIDESDVELPTDGVEYSAPLIPDDDEEEEKSPMDEIAEGIDNKVEEHGELSLADAVAEPDKTDIPVVDEEKMPSAAINPDTAVEHQKLTLSDKPGFDPYDVQDARKDVPQEGGIARNRTTGNQFRTDDGHAEGGQLRPNKTVGKPPDYSKMYEVAGFTASFEKTPGQGAVNVEILDHFIDLATAQSSVNGEKYLMPMPHIGFKIVDIVSGAPTISYQDRVLYEYINNKWRRK